MSFIDMSEEEFYDFVKETSAAYFAEEVEMELGVHPSQLIPKCKKYLREHGYDISLITFWDWSNKKGPNVVVTIGNENVLVNYEDLPAPSEEESQLYGYAM